MRTFKLTLAYDGANYAGWQSQPDQPTVQGALEAALAKITSEPVRTIASGRTDAGVHALAQVASFSSATQLAPEVLTKALNASLPRDMIVDRVEEAAADFHAIRDAVRKRYRYIIHDRQVPNPFERGFVWHHPIALNCELMSRAAECLLGKHDFASFESSGSERESSVRTVFELVVRRGPAVFVLDPAQTALDHIYIEVEADGFLYNMVRNIVGTLVEVGRGAQPVSWVAEVLTKLDRRFAGPTAPPHGLFLVRVDYEQQ